MAIRKNKPPTTDGIKYASGAGTETHDGIDYPQEHRTMDQLATGGRATMRKEHEEREHEREMDKKEHRKERSPGGGVKMEDKEGDEAEGKGDPEYFAGGESPTARAAKGDRTAKEGGRIKKKRKERKRGGAVVEGKSAHHRLDHAKPGMKRRAMGGGIGADMKPLTEANKLQAPKGDKRTPQDDPEDD